MRSLVKFLFLLLAVPVLVISCDLGDIEPQNTRYGNSFLPLEVGHYVVYDVQQILYDELNPNDSSEYQIKEEVAALETGLDNLPFYRIERFRRENSADRWRIDSVWTAREKNLKIIKTENNIPIVKLALPVENSKTWNANIYNDQGEDNFQIDSLGNSYEVASTVFPRTLIVNQQYDSSLVNRDVRWEVYADSVGMVYKKVELFKYITNSEDPFYGQDSIIGGVFLEMKAIDFGKN
ncbi:hypothetical protein R9C00_08450 [Flammeovirgaceae bacterium SG7u.111]|nr:hypothetical protein [Flammeovirgaceae bacterium SG7u.132]WPO37477.1 hypothetical protein R9C00_08450 [Flammeovirgaceae bacterium SG7u.111]